MTSLDKFDFAKLLEEGSGENSWTQDVVFVFKDSDGNIVGEIKANKLLLGLVSEVFRAQFFGKLSESSKNDAGVTKIEIVDMTYTGFKTMVQFMFSGKETIVTSIQDLDLLFEIFRLADKYFLPNLKSLVKTTIEKMTFSFNNYASVLRITTSHKDLLPFDDLCQDLLERCVIAVKKEWTSTDDFLLTDYKDDTATKVLLVEKIRALVCPKCSPPKLMKECRDGKKLTHDNCRVGMSVRLTKDMKSSATNDKLSAGTCGTVIEHCREGIYRDEDTNITIVLRVKWGEIVWYHIEASMQSHLVINEH